MITTLHVNKSAIYQDYDLEKGELGSLNRINLLIGQNNSGKSRFIRNLFRDSKFEFDLKAIDKGAVNNQLRHLDTSIKKIFTDLDVVDFEGLNGLLKTVSSWESIQASDFSQKIKTIYGVLLRLQNVDRNGSLTQRTMGSGVIRETLTVRIKALGKEVLSNIESLLPEDFSYSISKIYIPILRGLRPISNESKRDEYLERTYRDYFAGHKEEIKKEIFTGLNLYEDTKRLLLGKKEDRDKIKNFELFLSKTFFLNQEVNLIPHIDHDVIHVRIGDEEYPIHDLGDGIQSIIIILYPLFFNQGKTLLVFIEEPENSLHPGMQRILIETLLQAEFSSFQYFITTHSNHFLDITLDHGNISVYSFRKKAERKFEIQVSSDGDIKLLDLIGVRNSSVFLSNCTIWVEGITDRLYLKKYLEVYQKYLINEDPKKNRYLENLHYAFVEYAGANITHWNFSESANNDKIKALSISNKIFVVADSDNAKPNSAKEKRIEYLKDILDERFYVIEAKEIENTLSKKALLEVIASYEGKKVEDLVYDKKAFIPSKYKAKNLGEYIDSKFSGLKRSYQKESTISDKVNFCNKAIDHIVDYGSLTDEAKDLTESIYNFICINNLRE